MRHNPGYGIMAKFMKGGGKIGVRRSELILVGQRDRVIAKAITGAVAGNMPDRGAGIAQDRLGPLVTLPRRRHRPLRRRRQAFDLPGVEHHRRPHARSLVAHHLSDRLAVRAEHGSAAGIADRLQALPLPELDGRAFLALAHVSPLPLRLPERQPSGIAQTPPLGLAHQP
jgi:hypothetical protein